ncbi:MarR family winged helix-turn-helix transcriptional regulator [Catellatospora bangladeshensis]|uniref:MarR family transcriptional regulator n=1 Tax=Catellatospora bangladeshensis TaxID=310355 RepID=A0A8J3JLN5_9ACTN|nr:MarR family transcriptional regulator [Catellatospora bangladeshensis]GIF82822.1 MarR family transcriptional regulator [Catellatospora bangladeshensis]
MSETAQAATGTPAGARPRCDSGPDFLAHGPDLAVTAGLVQLTALVQSVYTRVSERHDLTPVQAKLLCVLLAGPRGMAELAQILGVEKAAMTGLMDRAERRDLARRQPVPGDRRAVQVTLTGDGRQAATAFHTEVGAELDDLVAALGAAGREQFRQAMAQILASCRDGGR